MSEKPVVNGKYLMYKGKPLVREKNGICYGSMSDKYVLFLAVLSTKKAGDLMIPDRIMIQILPTDPNDKTPPKNAIKQGFLESLELGMIWLGMANQA